MKVEAIKKFFGHSYQKYILQIYKLDKIALMTATFLEYHL